MASKFGPTLKSAGGAAAKPATAAPAPVPAPAPEEAGFPAFPRINVGGVEHQASLEALRSQPGSLLTDVFTGNAEASDCASGGGARRRQWRGAAARYGSRVV
jgi:hypothetical protein